MITALLVVLWASVALAETALTDVRVFSGEGHVRILLVLDGSPGAVQGRAVQAVGREPDRAVVRIGATTPGDGGARELPIRDPAVERLVVRDLGVDTEIEAQLTGPRAVRTQVIGETAVLVDLVEEGRGLDPTLPSAPQLRAWLDDVGLAGARAPRVAVDSRRVVVIDAGHGGWDHGAVGLTGTREADVALEIALRLGDALEARGFRVLHTRDTDVFVTLRDRAARANAADADLFLSVHVNAAPGPTAWGIETYSFDAASDKGAARVARRENAILAEQREDGRHRDPLLARMLVAGTNALSRQLSQAVQEQVVGRLREDYGDAQIRDLGAKTALFYVLVSTRMPSILFESGFLTNPDDERRLRTPHYQQRVAEGLAEAVEQWFAVSDQRKTAPRRSTVQGAP